MMNSLLKRALLTFRRNHSSLVISEEILAALAEKQVPVVSLESTIITHGLPFPQNVQMALNVETVIRNNGGIPATCAFIRGVPHIGLTTEELEYLARESIKGDVNKVSRRDIGATMCGKINGGTTIALTMILSHMAGIKVFATGGLGGVHRDGQFTMDVSADLTELGKTPVSVVCAGPKSILDIGLTMEYLETQGVYVGTYNDDGRSRVEVPGFYCRNSGVMSPYSFTDFSSVASTIHSQNNLMGLKSGNLICIPPPKETALDSELIELIILKANEEAKLLRISGKELTPFLLGKIAELTNGKSVECNVNFVYNNAKQATKIARELLKLETAKIGINLVVKKENDKITASDDKKIQRVEKIKANDRANVVVVGSLALDTIVSFKDKFKLQDSNPGLVRTSIGGVGHNVFFGCHYGLQSPFCGNQKSTRLVSIVGDDYNGNALINQLIGVGIDTLGILKSKSGFTAQYVSNHTSTGELVVACADMSIIEQDFSKHIITQIMRANPELVIIDCNVSSKVLTSILAFLQNKSIRVIIEPTSHVKAGRIGEATLEVFPQNVVDMISPTISELSTIHESFEDNGKFEDYDCWFPLLDLMGIDSQFRQKLDALANRPNFHVLKTILADGTFQKAFQLLPYLPNILIKLGDKGVIMVSLSTSVKSYKSIPTTSSYKPEFLITSQGQNDVGVVIKYFAIPIENKNIDIVNVTGAGDTLLGYLSATLVSCEEANWLDLEIKTIEQEWNLWESIYKSQLASGHVLQNEAATTPFIKNIN